MTAKSMTLVAQDVRRNAAHDGAHAAGYEWVALSVTTVGALLAAVQGSSLIIALPDVLTGLNSGFLTIMWVLLGYLLITNSTAIVADAFRHGRVGLGLGVPCACRRISASTGSAALRLSSAWAACCSRCR